MDVPVVPDRPHCGQPAHRP